MKKQDALRTNPAPRRYEAPVLVEAGRLVPGTRGARLVHLPEPDTSGMRPYIPFPSL